MSDRVILHCDMNNFYASVERIFDPSLRGVPVAVCGREEDRHGIVLAKSEEAKKMGVKTGDTVWQAKEKCPDIRIVLPHFDRYVKYSDLARAIYLEYTDLVEPFGLDECWLDVTASRLAFGDGVTIGNRLRERIKKELGLSISVGVSFNKVFAKLGSDLKKPDALTHISKENFKEMIWQLPSDVLLGVGGKTMAELRRFGLDTVGKLAMGNDLILQHCLGKNGILLKSYALGEDTTPVIPQEAAPKPKSIGHGMTVREDIRTHEEVWHLILLLCQEVGERLRKNGMKAEGIALDLKDRGFVSRSFQTGISPTDCTMTLAKEAFALFRSRYAFGEPLRAVTVRAIRLQEGGASAQLSLWEDPVEQRNTALDRVTDRLRARYGKDALKSASLLDAPLPSSHGYVPFRGTETEPVTIPPEEIRPL